MRRIATVPAVATLVGAGACSTDQELAAPLPTRVTGPAGLSYALPPGPWRVEPEDLQWTDDRGRRLAELSAATSFEHGYADAACSTRFSARAVVGFARGRSRRGVVRRFVTAVGGVADRVEQATWRAVLPDGTEARLARATIAVATSGRCRSRAVDLVVLTPIGTGVDHPPSWVFVGDRGPGSPPTSDVVSIAVSLRNG